jgi:Putative member of DMT superfamily (DUF486)
MRFGIIGKTVLLLIGSNTFMNMAWYGHLRFRGAWLPLAILASWLIALPEYALQVPANRIGAGAVGHAAQNHSRSDLPRGLRGLCLFLFSRSPHVANRLGLRPDLSGGFSRSAFDGATRPNDHIQFDIRWPGFGEMIRILMVEYSNDHSC